jgi:hypothetical protein
MNLQEIVEQVGGVFDVLALGRHDGVLFTPLELEEFVALVAAHEREECAKLFDVRDSGSGGYYEPHEPAEIIRARSKA